MQELLYRIFIALIAQYGIQAARSLMERTFGQATVGAPELEAECDLGAPFPEEFPECRPSSFPRL